MIVKHCGVDYFDERGAISDVLKDTPVENVAFITAKVNSKRGNHYHREATVYIFVVSGSFHVWSRMNGEVNVDQVRHGDLVEFPPNDLHTLLALEDSSFLLLAHGPRGGELTVQETLI